MHCVCVHPSKCHSITCPWRPQPIQALTGQVPDISHFLHFTFWEPVYYKVDENEPDHRLTTTRVIIVHGRYLLMKQTKS